MTRSLWFLDDDGKTPVPALDIETWSLWMHRHPRARFIAKTQVGSVFVSTVFLSTHDSSDNDTPRCFETKVFGGAVRSQRYHSYDDAIRGHEKIVSMIRNEEP